MRPIDMQTIEALIDGEITGKQASALRARISADPQLQACYNALSRQKNLLKAWWAARKGD